MHSRTRRTFFSTVGSGFLTGFCPSLDKAASTEYPANDRRAETALRLRIDAARTQFQVSVPTQLTNGDSERYATHLADYSKGLPHDSLGLVDAVAYEQLLRALGSGKWADFEAVPMGSAVKLSNPLAAFAYSLEGSDSHHPFILPPPAFSADTEAAEMVELYWQALTRDIFFADYASNTLIQRACSDLTKHGPTNEAVTSDSIFRAPLAGCLIGPYVSQFLCLHIPVDNLVLPQSYPCFSAGSDHLTKYDDWLNLQNGATSAPPAPLAPARFIANARDLAAYVHRDASYQAFLNAALILNGFGSAALSDTNPYKTSKTQASFVSLGLPGFVDWVARAANSALKAAWYQKWLVHRRLRPEEFGGRVQNVLAGKATWPISPRLFQSDVLNAVYAAQGSYLLAQAYPEGCPLHPSYPAAHATIAGACVTVLKALFDESFVIPEPMVALVDGSSLVPYTDQPLTVGGELNKAAANVALARDTAGVHWRSDSLTGLLLGEQVAISLLKDLVFVAADVFEPLSFHDFAGQLVQVQAGGDWR